MNVFVFACLEFLCVCMRVLFVVWCVCVAMCVLLIQMCVFGVCLLVWFFVCVSRVVLHVCLLCVYVGVNCVVIVLFTGTCGRVFCCSFVCMSVFCFYACVVRLCL